MASYKSLVVYERLPRRVFREGYTVQSGITKSYKFELDRSGDEWLLLSQELPWMKGWQQKIVVNRWKDMEEILRRLEGVGVAVGDKVILHERSHSSKFDQIKSLDRSGHGPIFEVCVSKGENDTLANVIGYGLFLVEFQFRGGDASWGKRLDVWYRQSAWERWLRQSLSIPDDCGFGIGLRGILTGQVNQERDRPVNIWERTQMGKDMAFNWMGPARLATELKSVTEQLELLLGSEQTIEGDKSGMMLGLMIKLLGDYRSMMEAYEKYCTAKPNPYASWYDTWDEKMKTPEWRSALQRVEAYKNDAYDWTWLDSQRTPLKE